MIGSWAGCELFQGNLLSTTGRTPERKWGFFGVGVGGNCFLAWKTSTKEKVNFWSPFLWWYIFTWKAFSRSKSKLIFMLYINYILKLQVPDKNGFLIFCPYNIFFHINPLNLLSGSPLIFVYREIVYFHGHENFMVFWKTTVSWALEFVNFELVLYMWIGCMYFCWH